MLRGDWNALQIGDRVLVHHDGDGGTHLLAGVVMSIGEGDGSNVVTVRVRNPRPELINPQRLRVHHDPIEPDTHCWRCASHAPPAATAKQRHG